MFLAAVDFVRHLVFPSQLHTWAGFLATYLLVAVAVVVFSWAVFGVIGHLQEQTARQNRQLQALNQIAVTAGESLRLDELLNSTLDRVMELTGATAGLICGLEADWDELVAACSRGLSPAMVERVRRAKVSADPMGEQAVRTGRPVVNEKLFDDPRVAEMARRAGFRSAISVPSK
ncbi:MAG: GAF domain-containing protein [Chloroflexi bacterium]|nr:GAF domain-containing protein [Chloroflexota bacterium]